MLRVDKVSKVFRTEGVPDTPALQELCLDVDKGRFVVIVGPNGCGKSTLLKVIGGDLKPDQGTVEIDVDGEKLDLLRLRGRQRGRVVTRVEQDPRFGTVADLTIWENLWLSTGIDSWGKLFSFGSPRKVMKYCGDLLVQLGFSLRLDTKVKDLSGGQRQVIAVLVAVLRKPRLLLLDEHTASLDRRNADICLSLAANLVRREGQTVISVTHNLVEALETGDRLIVMRDGRVAHDFSRSEIERLNPMELGVLMKLQSNQNVPVDANTA